MAPIGGDDGEDIQSVAQGFYHAFGSAEGANPGQDMGRVGSLLSLSFEPSMFLTQSYHCFYKARFSRQSDQPCPELGEHSVVKAGVKYFET